MVELTLLSKSLIFINLSKIQLNGAKIDFEAGAVNEVLNAFEETSTIDFEKQLWLSL